MNYQDKKSPRKMYQGDWQCAKCSAEIKELPFIPDCKRPVYCRECHKSMMKNR